MSDSGSDGSSRRVSGNTKKPRPNASKNWFFTYNNFGSNKISFQEKLEEICDKYIFQVEVGEQGTKHLQGCIELKIKGRPLELFKEFKGIHWEKTKSKNKAVEYCQKEATKEDGPWAKGYKINPPPEYLKYEDMKDWQKELVDMCIGPAENRKIHVYVDIIGGSGKSAVARHLVIKHGALLVAGKAADMKSAIASMLKAGKEEPTILILDIPRSVEHVSWGGLEEIKNGTFFSQKYESSMVILRKSPHVVVLTNHEIENGTYSEDRIVLHEIYSDFVL